MHKLLELTVFGIIGTVLANLIGGSSTLIEQDVNGQNMTNASNLTGVRTAVVVQASLRD